MFVHRFENFTHVVAFSYVYQLIYQYLVETRLVVVVFGIVEIFVDDEYGRVMMLVLRNE